MIKKTTFTLLTKMTILTGALALLATFMTQSYFMRHERTSLEMRLREKANFVNNFYAFLIADALQHNDDITLLQVVERLEQDPEITSVIVIDAKGEVRYHVDPEKIGALIEDPLLKSAMESGQGIASDFTNSGGRALALVTPLKIKDQNTPQGAVRIEFTYRHLFDQVKSGQASFHAVAMGAMMTVIGGILWGVRRWVLVPLTRLRATVQSIQPAFLDSTFEETPDEFGQMHATLNEFLAKLRIEWSGRQESRTTQASDERSLIEQLIRGLMPEVRLLIVDADNLLICDTQRSAELPHQDVPHLLDVVTDHAFVNLVGTAVEKAGEIIRGPVQFEEKPYDAAVLRVLEGQSMSIKMIIALKQPN